MKRLLLTVTCLGLLMTVHAQYNVFDAADVDEQGWLWFDSQAKIDRYVGLEGSGKLIEMIAADYEPFEDDEASADFVGAGTDGNEGGPEAKKGAIKLVEGQTSGSSDGGGIYMKISDCVEFSLFLSSEGRMAPGVYRGEWSDILGDFALVNGYMPTAWTQLSKAGQYTWNNIQELSNANTGATIGSEGDVAVYIKNQGTSPLFIHGIKLLSSKLSGMETSTKDKHLEILFDGTTIRLEEKAEINVYDSKGALVCAATASGLSTQGLAQGVYIVKAHNEKAQNVLKIVVR